MRNPDVLPEFWNACSPRSRQRLRSISGRPIAADVPGTSRPGPQSRRRRCRYQWHQPGVSSTAAAPMFSSRRCSFVVPGIGTIQWSLRQQPGERDLRRDVHFLRRRKLAEQIDQRLVCPACLRGEARHDVAEIGAVERRILADRAGEKALAQRAEGDEANSEFFERRQHLLLGLPPPQRILALKGCDRLHGVRTADGLHAGLGQAEMPDLALADQVLVTAPATSSIGTSGSTRCW